MRIIIYGAGAIGGVFGGHLALAGIETLLIGRPAQIYAIKQNGLRLITPTETHTLFIPAVTAPDQVDFKRDDIIFLCVKSQDTEKALCSLKAAVSDVPVFCFQNGVRNEEIASKFFSRVYGVKVQTGAKFVNYGEVISRSVPPGSPIMGCYPSGVDSLLEDVVQTVRKAGFSVLASENIMSYKWGQLLNNLANVVAAITDNGDEKSYDIIRAVRQEASVLMEEAGIRWISDEEIAKAWPEGVVQLSKKDIRENSTWQSLIRKQGHIETEYFNGEIVRIAQQQAKEHP